MRTNHHPIIVIETVQRDYRIPFSLEDATDVGQLSPLARVQAVIREVRKNSINEITCIEVGTESRGRGGAKPMPLFLLKKNKEWGYDYEDETRKPLIATLRKMIATIK